VNQKLISLGAGAAAVGAIAVASLVFVGNGQDTTVSALELSDAQVSQIQADLANTPTADQAAYLQKLAGKLGVSVDALTAAIKATNLEILDEKVASGDLTQEQADAARTRIENGDGPLFGIGGPKPGADHSPSPESVSKAYRPMVSVLPSASVTRSPPGRQRGLLLPRRRRAPGGPCASRTDGARRC